MKEDKLKSLLITITGELRKLSKEELLNEASCAKGFSCIMMDANLLTSGETHYEYLGYDKTNFGSFDDYNQKGLDIYSVGGSLAAADNYDYALAA